MTVLKSVLGPVTKAVYAVLNGDAALATILGGSGRIHTSSPAAENAPPYVRLADIAAIPRRVCGGGLSYHDGSFTIEVWDDGTTVETIMLAAERIATLLDDVALPIAGFATVFVHLGQERRDPLTPGQERVSVPFTFMVRRANV